MAKSKDFQLTLRAGGRSFSHKHIDDLSITLWAGGKDFIVDAGLYNYDINDKMRRWLISARSHSLFYLESIGDVRFANFESPMKMSRFLEIERDSKFFRLKGSHDLSKEATVFREISYSGSSIFIEDQFSSDFIQKWRFQLLLHPDVLVRDAERGVVLKNGDKEVTISILDNKDHVFSLENAHYSDSFMKLMPTKMLVIKGVGCTAKVKCLIDF